MGNNDYNFSARAVKSATVYQKQTVQENFKRSNCHIEMDPIKISLREARDSEKNPNSFPIIIGLDVTGSMQTIPQELIQHSLPKIIFGIKQLGILHPAVCFIAIGDHKSDNSPLQIGQFESGDNEMDKWLENTYLEGNGGGNGGETYSAAWLVGGFMTSTDSFEKRGVKGILITFGDEDFHSVCDIKTGLGGDIPKDSLVLLKEAQKKYEVFHIAIPRNGTSFDGETNWKNTLGKNYIQLSTRSVDNIAPAIINCIKKSCVDTKNCDIVLGEDLGFEPKLEKEIEQKEEVVL